MSNRIARPLDLESFKEVEPVTYSSYKHEVVLLSRRSILRKLHDDLQRNDIHYVQLLETDLPIQHVGTASTFGAAVDPAGEKLPNVLGKYSSATLLFSTGKELPDLTNNGIAGYIAGESQQSSYVVQRKLEAARFKFTYNPKDKHMLTTHYNGDLQLGPKQVINSSLENGSISETEEETLSNLAVNLQSHMIVINALSRWLTGQSSMSRLVLGPKNQLPESVVPHYF